MGKAAALLAVKQMCRHSHTMPAESETLPASKARSKTLASNRSLFPHCHPGALEATGAGQTAPGQEHQATFDTSRSLAFQKRARDMLVVDPPCPHQGCSTLALW